jgi:hypothetical protein
MGCAASRPPTTAAHAVPAPGPGIAAAIGTKSLCAPDHGVIHVDRTTLALLATPLIPCPFLLLYEYKAPDLSTDLLPEVPA